MLKNKKQKQRKWSKSKDSHIPGSKGHSFSLANSAGVFPVRTQFELRSIMGILFKIKQKKLSHKDCYWVCVSEHVRGQVYLWVSEQGCGVSSLGYPGGGAVRHIARSQGPGTAVFAGEGAVASPARFPSPGLGTISHIFQMRKWGKRTLVARGHPTGLECR